MSARPPRWVDRLLERTLPTGGAGRSARSDLDTEFRERTARGEPGVRAWYVWEGIKLSSHFVVRGLGEAVKGGGIMSGWGRQLRSAVRQFRLETGFMATAIGTIALGIGATVTIFSIVEAVVLSPLPYDEPDQLVAVWEWNVPRDRHRNVANPGNFVAWRERASSMADMSGVSIQQPSRISVDGRTDEVMVQAAVPNFFDLLGVDAALGTTFTQQAEEGVMEIVLSDAFWRRYFAADPAVLGRSVDLNGFDGTVVGVLAPGFVIHGQGTELWRSFGGPLGDQTDSGRWMMVVGRMNPDTSPEAADVEMRGIAAALEQEYPDFNGGWSAEVFPMADEVVGDVRAALWMFLGAVGILLLIANANVAGLFMVRATHKRQTLAVHAALGATRFDLLRQGMVEAAVVAATGALVGVVGAHAAIAWMATSMPDAFRLPRIEEATVVGGALWVAVGITVLTTLVFGALPTLHVRGGASAGVMRAEGRGSSRGTVQARRLLVVAEVALSVVLLAGAGLFVRSLSALMSVDDGIAPEHVLVARINLAGPSYSGDQAKTAFFAALHDSLRALPGVEATGGTTFLPMNGSGAGTSFWPADRPEPEADDRRAADIRNVSGDYFDAMGIELLGGRTFDGRDGPDDPQRVIVNRALADRYWPGQSAVGQSLVVNWVDHEPWEIIGVVADVRASGPAEPSREAVYIHYPHQTFFPWQQVAVRVRGEPAVMADALRSTVARLDPQVPVGQLQVMQEVVDRAVAQPRMQRTLMLVFAVLATLLAAVGLYGLLAYTVSRRVREIGVRMALGAQPDRVVGSVLAQGLSLVGGGLLIGLVASAAMGRLVAGLLHGVQPIDPLSLAGAGAVIGCVACVACAVPALRAARIPPSDALRPE